MTEAAKQAEPTRALTVVEQNKKQIVNIVQTDSFKNQLAAALMGRLPQDYVIRSAIATLNSNPKIQECTPLSVAASILLLAQAGLAPEPWKGHGYLVPRSMKIKENGKPDRWEMRCTALIGYRGYLNLAYKSPEVTKAIAHPVYEGDIFDFDQVAGTVTHKPWIRPEKDRDARGKILGAYALVKMRNGEALAEWMPVEDIEATRTRSAAGDSGPWKTDYAEMARKTPFRRLFKWLPDPDLQRIAALEEASDFGNMTVTLDGATGEIITQVAELPEPEQKQPIQMPKRQEAITAGTQAVSVTIEAKPAETVTEKQTSPVGSHAEIVAERPQNAATEAKSDPEPVGDSETTPEPSETEGEPVSEPPAAFVGENLFDGPAPTAAVPAESKEKVIGVGQASRLKAIMGAKKVRSKQDLEDFKKAFKIEHLKDLPSKYLNAAEKWAAGEEDNRFDKTISTAE